ncbi:PAS domain S-box protein [Sulfurimonas sp.]|uniref:PAS domain S-box protein n=1 Tax=Sulfurimonas sp. TaxID=2022749 RepID=UPI0035660C4E
MKKLDTSSLRKSVTFSIVITMFILIVVIVAITNFVYEDRDKSYEKKHSLQVHRSIDQTINHYVKEYVYINKRIIQTTKLATLLEKKDRESIYKLLKPKWDLMREEESTLKTMHFHLKDGHSFLRMHMPNIYGDKLTHIRPMIKEIHTSHKTISGFETGTHNSLYRIITPIFDSKNKYIGALEVGLDLNFIINELKDINGVDGLVFIKNDKLSLPKSIKNKLLDGYEIQSTPHGNLDLIYRSLKTLDFKRQDVTVSTANNDYKVHIFSLNDFENKPKIKILIFHDILESFTEEDYLLIIQLSFILISLAILVWFIYTRIKSYENCVTEVYRKQILKIHESQHLLAKSQKITHIGSWKLNIASNRLIWSDEIYNIFEIDPKKIGATYEDFLNAVHPDDKKAVNSKYLESLENKTPYSLEHRLLMKDGRIKFVKERCETTFDELGNALVSIGTIEDITKQKELLNELEFNRDYLQNIIDVLPNIVIVTDGEKIKRANRTMLDFTGYQTLDEFKKDHDCICDFFIEEENTLMPFVDELTWLAYIFANPNQIHEASMVHDGKVHRFIVQAQKLPISKINTQESLSVVTFADVTEIEVIRNKLNNSNKVLLENEEKLRAITDSALDAIIMLDNDGKFIFWNPKAKAILGYEEDELLGKDFHKIVAPKAFHEAAKKGYKKFAKTGEGDALGKILELSAIKKGGHEFPVSLLLNGVLIDGKWHGIGFLRDLSETKKMENELKQKDEIMLAQSRQAAMGDMISMIAHQWRQPITAISMGAQNMQLDIELEDVDYKRFNEKLAKIVEQTSFLSKTIDDFRNFLKPNKKADSCMLSELVEGTLGLIGKSLENNNITLNKSFKNDIEIITFYSEVIQVLLNIINNSKDIILLKNMSDGTIEIKIDSDAQNVYIEICDNAGGISDDVLPRIFEPYFTTKDEKGGTGLGLYMSQMIVEKHLKGTIVAQNINGGACFKLSLPRKSTDGE